MKCPVCSKEMVEQDFGGVKVDICVNGCKGIWFDNCELVKLDEKNEGMGNALKEALLYPRNNNNQRPPINCPKCNLPMHIHKYQRAKEVNVDECYACAGFFLDSGEITEVRDTYMSDKEADAYVNQLVSGVPEYKMEQDKLNAKKEIVDRRVKAINKYAAFLRFNYWEKKFNK